MNSFKDLTSDSLESLNDGDLRKACQVVLQRDIGPITDSTRELYRLAVKRALIGHPIAFESITENNPEVSFDDEQEGAKAKESVFYMIEAQTIIPQNQLVSNPSTGTAGDGPFYVMMTPSQEIVTHTSLRKRSSSASEGSRNPRDEKRRATHNEVERRRRDKINNWITKLADIVPDCAQDRTKQGQSKGGILAKACEYINQLVKENAKLKEIIKENERTIASLYGNMDPAKS
ncbi:transcription factor EB-like isoform X2 [Panonychus citri]|uniref:transcription factor EB-like isoform X2 n=1 Tax=Panonychus citri TaxID=50023 RepID=UPI002307E522|nr:transcription factor EB-like isoform X2 [Panonychus citri]